MKNIIKTIVGLIGIVTLGACSPKEETFSLKEAAGFEVSNISGIVASSSVAQSYAWHISEEAYPYLDCKYVKADFDIENEFFHSFPSSENQDDAFPLHITIEDVDIYADVGQIFYISHSTNYMYFDGLDGTYRSQYKMPLKFIHLIVNSGEQSESDSSEPTGTFKLTIIDTGNFIYDKPEERYSYFAPGNEIVLHSYPIMDADLAMYVNGEFYSIQKTIETSDGYIWEYRFVMPIGEATLEFKIKTL